MKVVIIIGPPRPDDVRRLKRFEQAWGLAHVRGMHWLGHRWLALIATERGLLPRLMRWFGLS